MISGTFEYLISSLPNLSFRNTNEAKQKVLGILKKYAGSSGSALSPVEILDKEAEKFLPNNVFLLFQKINLKNIHQTEFQKNKNKVLSAFSKFIFEFKKGIKIWRTSKNSSEKKSNKNSIEKIISDGTPLEKELRILKYQWEKLEELSVGHFSDVEAVFIYKIKLLILLRWWSFDAEKGFDKFTRLTANN